VEAFAISGKGDISTFKYMRYLEKAIVETGIVEKA
jgi:hypothetical protein